MQTNDEVKVTQILNEVIGETQIESVRRMGGMTNRTYCVNVAGEKAYVVRLPGEGTEEMISRIDEKKSMMLACDLGIDTKLYYFDAKTGIKVMDYIQNSKTMNSIEMQKEENLERAAKVLSKLHSCGKDTGVLFDVVEMAEVYEKVIKENGISLYDDYEEVKKTINLLKEKYIPTVTKVPCHNDPLCENWVLQRNETMFLVDWEYAGMNDPMWDVADISIEAELTEELDRKILGSYFGREPQKEEWRAFEINKVLIDYLWSLWGKTRVPYDGEKLEQYAYDRYQRMKKNMEKIDG